MATEKKKTDSRAEKATPGRERSAIDLDKDRKAVEGNKKNKPREGFNSSSARTSEKKSRQHYLQSER